MAKAAGLFTPESTEEEEHGVLAVPAQVTIDAWLAKRGKKDEDKDGE